MATDHGKDSFCFTAIVHLHSCLPSGRERAGELPEGEGKLPLDANLQLFPRNNKFHSKPLATAKTKDFMEPVSTRKGIEKEQLKRLRRMLPMILPTNEFYGTKFADAGFRQVESLKQFRNLPFTTKAELVEDQQNHPPFGSDLTYPEERYIRVHQTSGTTGKPMYWLDT